MKQFFLTLLVLFFTVIINAQKIKIDKGEIKLDDKMVGYLEGKNPVFKISNLDKSYTVTVELKNIPNPGAAIPWMQLRNDTTGKLNEIEFKKFNVFNYSKGIVTALLDYNYLDANGLNTEKLESFINGEPTEVSAKLIGAKNEVDQANKIIDSHQLAIDDSGIIYSIKAQNPDPADKRIGYIRMTSPSSNGELKYEVLDLDNYLIATWFAKSGTFLGYNSFLNQELITFDKKVLKAVFDNSGNPIGYKMSKDITAMNIVRVLIGNGYTLQHQGIYFEEERRKEQIKLNSEKYETAKLNSTNIYDKNGFIINEKGENITCI